MRGCIPLTNYTVIFGLHRVYESLARPSKSLIMHRRLMKLGYIAATSGGARLAEEPRLPQLNLIHYTKKKITAGTKATVGGLK